MKKELHLRIISFLLLSMYLSSCVCWIPGMTFNSYKRNDTLEIKVGKINSIKTQFPFSFYDLPVCYQNDHTQSAENLGEILTGDYTFSTHYEVLMFQDEYCKVLCARNITNEYEENIFTWMITREYTSSWYLDNLPAGLNYTYKNGIASDRVIHDHGIPIGESLGVETKYSIYNHLTFEIFVNKDAKSDKPYSIVEFNIIPWSHESNGTLIKTHCAKNEEEFRERRNWQPDNQVYAKINEEIVYTYDVIFYESKLKWSSRWDHLLESSKDDNIHWVSFINSTLVILIFAALLGHIFFRALKRDIDYINSKRAVSDDVFDDSSWKQVSNDVFRKPRYAMLLSVFVGTGIQLFAMLLVTLIIGTIGFLNPYQRGGLLTMMLLLFVFMGGIAGYWSAKLYKMFNGADWLKTALFTAVLYPSFAFSIFFLVNFFLVLEDSLTVPFSTIMTLLLLWLCCSSPLVLIGAFIGIKKKAMKNPCKVNPVPSSIPQQPWYLEIKFISMIAGILPFGAIFIELVYIMGSIWKHYFHYVFSFILIVIIILLVTSSEISMVVAYFQLSKGDYRWWWKSFLVSGSVGFYIAAYAIYYYLTTLQMTRLSSIILYFSYMFLGSFTAFLITGSIGFISTYFFLRKIYSMIKID